MAFADSTSAFFDELSSILEGQQADKEEHMDMTNDRPYSSMLTQDEEPVDRGNPHSVDLDEPEVVTRAYA